MFFLAPECFGGDFLYLCLRGWTKANIFYWIYCVCGYEPPSFLLITILYLHWFARCFAPRQNIFRQCICILQLLGREPPSLSKKKMYISTIFTILQHREPASLKTFPAPLGALKRKRVRLEARGRFSTLYFYKGLYFDSKRRTAWAAPRSKDLAQQPLSSCPLSCMLLLRLLL